MNSTEITCIKALSYYYLFLCFFLLTIPKCLPILSKIFITVTSLYTFCISKGPTIRLIILERTNTPFLNLSRRWCRIKSIVRYATLDKLPRYTEAVNTTKWWHCGMFIHTKTNFVLAPMLYLLYCHRRQDIRPSRPYVSPHTRLRSIGVPRRVLGACKYSVGRRRTE